MKNEPALKLAISMHTNPGVYALLIGSGVSKPAGIPTGWEIVLDIIRKVAYMEGEKPTPDLKTWYQQRFGEAPDCSKLLDRLTITPAERMALLRSYFEPTEEEREQGLKVPTPTHRAIATLAKHGYVRMILTTNFDRLIEMALEEAGIVPDVRELPVNNLPILIIPIDTDFTDLHRRYCRIIMSLRVESKLKN